MKSDQPLGSWAAALIAGREQVILGLVLIAPCIIEEPCFQGQTHQGDIRTAGCMSAASLAPCDGDLGSGRATKKRHLTEMFVQLPRPHWKAADAEQANKVKPARSNSPSCHSSSANI